MKKVVFISTVLLVLFSCQKNTEQIDFGYEYFPMEEGTFVEYNVLEVFHDVDIFPQHDTLEYRLKTQIGEEVLDNSGRLARKFFQFKYDLSTGEVLDQRVWTRIIDEGRAEVVEENQRIIRMVFAVNEGKEWDINAFNPRSAKEVYYSTVNEEQSINGFNFKEATKVNYDDFLSLVDYRKKHEVYAKGVGLVERSFKDFTINNFDTTEIQKGTETHYKIVDYGVE